MRPILVGLDPGRNGPEPLSPYSPSGWRLARYAGMTREEFQTAFDRVNLYPCITNPVYDDRAAQNLLPLLRGRRVVALGRRVSKILGFAASMEWFVQYGYVGTSFPHPSGRSHWWNDTANVVDAERFLGDLRRPCIHVEGPDGSGKSTLVDQLGLLLKCTKMRTQDPPRSWGECLRRINQRVAPGLVCDRSSGLISELVYGPVLRGGTVAPESVVWDVVQSLVHAVVFVYCRPGQKSLQPTFRRGEDPLHVRAVTRKSRALVEQYDRVMAKLSSMGARVIRYDWTYQSPEEVARCVG